MKAYERIADKLGSQLVEAPYEVLFQINGTLVELTEDDHLIADVLYSLSLITGHDIVSGWLNAIELDPARPEVQYINSIARMHLN